jgi:hypothetical protein
MSLRVILREGSHTTIVASEWVAQHASVGDIFTAAQAHHKFAGTFGKAWIERRVPSSQHLPMATYEAPQHLDATHKLAGLGEHETLCLTAVSDAPPHVPESKHPPGGRFFQTQQEFLTYLQTNC